MRILLSVASGNRLFLKAMRRIRPVYGPHITGYENIVWSDLLLKLNYGILHDATLKCRFSVPDQEKVDALFAEYSLEKLRELSKT